MEGLTTPVRFEDQYPEAADYLQCVYVHGPWSCFPWWLGDQNLHYFPGPIHIGHQAVKAEGYGRNSPCPCGSGKKWKKCCQRN